MSIYAQSLVLILAVLALAIPLLGVRLAARNFS
jgi:hypothetical protein